MGWVRRGQRSPLNGLGEEQYSGFGAVPLALAVLVESCFLCFQVFSCLFGNFII